MVFADILSKLPTYILQWKKDLQLPRPKHFYSLCQHNQFLLSLTKSNVDYTLVLPWERTTLSLILGICYEVQYPHPIAIPYTPRTAALLPLGKGMKFQNINIVLQAQCSLPRLPILVLPSGIEQTSHVKLQPRTVVMN